MTPELINRLGAQAVVRQFLRFLLVGGGCTVLQYLVMYLMIKWRGLDFALASNIGYLAGAVVNYSINRVFTFESETAYGRGLLKFILLVLVALVLNYTIVRILTTQFRVHVVIAQILATGTTLFWNFFGSRLFVFPDAKR